MSRPVSLRLAAFAGLTLSLLGMTACSDTGSRHPGLSPDGYGFVQDSPVLAPPEHLMQHQAPAMPQH